MMSTVLENEQEAEVAPLATRTVRVGLAGCGAVGSALLRELDARRDVLTERHGVEVVLARILVRDVHRERMAPFDRRLLTSDVRDFLATDVDVVIEAMGGLDPARRIARETLARSRDLVTANKELLAAYGSELHALASRTGATLRYDAAVGGGVPVLRLLDDALGAGTPTRVRGILNGTSNFVLCRLEGGADLNAALVAARAAGFAEADASRDLDGRDAAAKLALVAWAAFGVSPESLTVRCASLLPDPERYVRLAARFDRVVRQIADCSVVNGRLMASVEPVLVLPRGALAQTRDEENRVEVHTGWSAPLCASGPGAGGLPTATALISDLLARRGDRRRASRPSVPSADVRRARWAVEVRGAPALLHRHAPGSGLVHTDALSHAAWSIVESATADEMDAVLAALRAHGGDPVAARFDDVVDARAGGWT